MPETWTQSTTPFASFWTPFRTDARTYDGAKARRDLTAGFTVALFAVPQAMAYAMLAGVAPAHGLYAAVVMSIVAALWGSSAFINTGPTNSASLLTAAALLPFAQHPELMRILFAFTLLVGLLRLALGLIHAGYMIRFVPESGFLGFTVGAGTLIALGQLHHLFNVPAGEHPAFLVRMGQVLAQLPQLNLYTLVIGLAVFGVLMRLHRHAKRFPVAVIALLLASIAAHLLGLDRGVRLVRDIAAVPGGLPGLSWPIVSPQIMADLLPAALAVAVIGLVEAVSIGQTLALRHGKTLDFDQEFVGQGLSQIAGAFFQCIPGSGSFSRSLLIEQSGGVTRFSNVAFGLFTALALLLAPGLLNRIPVAALAGLLLYIGIKLIDVPQIRRVWATSRADAVVMLLTFLVTVFVRIQYGIFVAVLAGMVIFYRNASQLRMAELLPRPDGEGYDEIPYEDGSEHARSDLIAVGVFGDLFYGLAQDLRAMLNNIVERQRPTHLVLRVRRAYSLDYSCWNALFDFASAFQAAGGKLYLAGVRPDFEQIINKAGMREVLPPDRVIPQGETPFAALRLCVERARADLSPNSTLSPAWSAQHPTESA